MLVLGLCAMSRPVNLLPLAGPAPTISWRKSREIYGRAPAWRLRGSAASAWALQSSGKPTWRGKLRL
jgi:hypothetical protein